MYFKLIKLVVLFSLLACCRFAGKVLYSPLFNRVIEGKDPRYIMTLSQSGFSFNSVSRLSLFTAGQSRSLTLSANRSQMLYLFLYTLPSLTSHPNTCL